MNRITLNKEQELGSDPKHSQFLIANAGSGKTFVLIERFKNIINTKLDELSIETIGRFEDNKSNITSVDSKNIIANQEIILKEIIEDLKDNFNFYFFVICSFSEKTSFDLQQKELKKLKEIKSENYNNFKSFIEKNNLNIIEIAEFFKNIQNDKIKENIKEEEDIKKLFENHNVFDLIINNNELFNYYLNIKFIDFFIENIFQFNVSTIHSFCVKIIKEFYYEMDIEPDYKVNEFYLTILSFEEAFIILNDPILLKLYNEKYNLNLNIKNEIDGHNDFEKITELLFIFYNLFAESDKNGHSKESNLKTFFKDIAKEVNIQKIDEAIDYFAMKINLTNDENDIYKYAKEFNEDLLLLIRLYFKIINGIYKKYNIINYDQQLSLVEKFLKDENHKEITQQFANRIEYLMIDEFQDSDIIQTSIFETLSAKNPKMSLFFVGDPKQSIYKFRGSDIRIFNRTKEHYKNTNRVSENYLETSYRSTPNLSSYVNDFFNRFLEEKKTEIPGVKNTKTSNTKTRNTKSSKNKKNVALENTTSEVIVIKSDIDKNVGDYVDKKADNTFIEADDISFEYNNLKYPTNKYYPDEIKYLENPSKYDKSFENFGRIDIILGYKKVEEKNKNNDNEKAKSPVKNDSEEKTKNWEEVSKYILDLVENHKILDKNKDNETIERKIEFRDIAILSRNNFKELDINKISEVFDKKQINYELGKNTKFYEDEIIVACIGFLEFVFDNTNNNALYDLLLSKFYGFDDETLFFTINLILKLNNVNPEEVKYYSLWSKLKLINDLNLDIDAVNSSNFNSTNNNVINKQEILDNLDFLIYIQNMLNEINSYLKLYSKVFASELLIMFLKNNYFYNNLEQFIGQNEINILHLNINKFLQLIHNTEKDGFVDFSELINQVKNLKLKDDEETLDSKKEDNSVSIMTIHNSKGLEFPVVILVGAVSSMVRKESLERETGIINNFEALATFDKEYLRENKILKDNSIENIASKLNNYNQHLNNTRLKHLSFQQNKAKYEELEVLNLTYVAFTRAINVFCVIHELTYKISKNGTFDTRDDNSIKYIIPNYILKELKVYITEGKLYESTMERLVKFYDNSSESNEIEYKIPINLKLFYKADLGDSVEDSELVNNNNYNKNNYNNTVLSEDGEVGYDDDNDDNDKVNNIENKNYIFEVKDKFFSATKLLSLNSQKLNYEFKYLLGMNDRLALQLEEEEKSEKNYLSEFDEFDLYNFSIFNKATKEKITKEIYDKKDLNLKTAAEFGLSFHFIMQNIKFLFDKITLELNNDILDDLIIECKNQYKLLNEEKVEKIKLILNKISGSQFLSSIYENYENIKTEFSLNIPFYKIKDNETLHFLNGNLDLIYKNKSNEIIILDWKTNLNVDENTRDNYRMQATMYKYMMSNLYPENKIRFQFVFTKDILEKIDEKDWIFEPDLQDDILELENNIKDKISEIISLETHLYD